MRLFALLCVCTMAGVALSGCATVKARKVTAEHWSNESTFYVAYKDTEGSDTDAKVRKCRVQASNEVVCEEQNEINGILNPPE